MFWQSIASSENPAMFDAYLDQFPNGVFRALAEARLAELRALVDNAAGAAPDRNLSRAAAGDALSQDQPFQPDPQGPTCTGQAEGADCWKELTNGPGCHVWDDYYFADQTVTWTGACSDGLASGVGTLHWIGGGATFEASGTLREGKRTGYWILRDADGSVHEGPYVNDERNGHWVIRYADGTVSEGAYMNGERHGNHVIRWASGTVEERRYVNGEWVR